MTVFTNTTSQTLDQYQYKWQYLGAAAEPMLRATPIFRVGVTLSSAKKGTTFTVRSIVASAGNKT